MANYDQSWMSQCPHCDYWNDLNAADSGIRCDHCGRHIDQMNVVARSALRPRVSPLYHEADMYLRGASVLTTLAAELLAEVPQGTSFAQAATVQEHLDESIGLLDEARAFAASGGADPSA